MNIIIIVSFSIILFYRFIDTNKDILILPILSFMIFSDWFFLEIGMNSDVINVGLIFCMVLLLLPEKIPEQKKVFEILEIIPKAPNKIDRKIIAFAILFGCLLAMRIFIWLVGMIIVLYLLKTYGLKNTFKLGLITLSVFLICILPFMLQDVYYFIFVNPLGHNSIKFTNWRPYESVELFGYVILYILNFLLNYGIFNGIIISIFIIIISIILGIIKCNNKFHLLLIISISYFIFLFFLFHTPLYIILRDYISIAAIPFTFSFLFIDLEGKSNKNGKKIMNS